MKYKRTPASMNWMRSRPGCGMRWNRMLTGLARNIARCLHEQLKAEGFAGHYARVTEAIRAQFDWRGEGIVIGGIWRRVHVAYMGPLPP